MVLASFEFEERSQVCAQFQQRGIEGVICIDAVIPPGLNLPVTSVNIEYRNSLTSLSGLSDALLSEVGDSAADSVVKQIEKPGSSRRVKIQGMPSAFAALPSMQFGLSSAGESA